MSNASLVNKIVGGLVVTVILGIGKYIGTKIDEDVCAVAIASSRLEGIEKKSFYCLGTREESIEKAMARLRSKDVPKAASQVRSPEPPKAATSAARQHLPEAEAAQPPVAPATKVAIKAPAAPSVAAEQPLASASPASLTVDKACAQLSLPRSAYAPDTVEQSLCALAACAGAVAHDDPGLELLLEWNSLQRRLESQPCRSADRSALSDLKNFARIRDAISAVPIPSVEGGEKAIEAREICRALQNRLTLDLEAARLKLRQFDDPPPSCPRSAANVSAEVQSFNSRHGFR